MGLRIIDRNLGSPNPPEDPKLRKKLEWEAACSFANFRGQDNSQDHFLAKLHAAHERVLRPDEMLDRATEIRTSIKRMHTEANPIHVKIDIATLIELL